MTLRIVIEHLEGGPVMKRTLEPIPEAQAHKYFCDVLAGLEYRKNWVENLCNFSLM